MSYGGSIPWGKFAIWLIVMIVGVYIWIYAYGSLSMWITLSIGQDNIIYQIFGWSFLFFVLWPFFCMYKMVKAWKQANATNIPPPPSPALQQAPYVTRGRMSFREIFTWLVIMFGGIIVIGFVLSIIFSWILNPFIQYQYYTGTSTLIYWIPTIVLYVSYGVWLVFCFGRIVKRWRQSNEPIMSLPPQIFRASSESFTDSNGPKRTEEAYIGKRVRENLLNEAKSRLFDPDENLACVIRGLLGSPESGLLSKQSGLLLITSKRVMFYVPKIFGGAEQLVFPYDQISNVNLYKSFVIDKLEFTVGSNKMLLDSVAKGDADVAGQIIVDMVATLKAQSSVVAPVPQLDIADQIEKLGRLREKGLLTDEEFERKKNELLERL